MYIVLFKLKSMQGPVVMTSTDNSS